MSRVTIGSKGMDKKKRLFLSLGRVPMGVGSQWAVIMMAPRQSLKGIHCNTEVLYE